jgi:hypothetical protein
VQYADRLDPRKWSFPVAERAAQQQQIYLDEGIFRAGKDGIDATIEAFLKLQRHSDTLRQLLIR